MGAEDHHERAGNDPVNVAIVTVSDTRTPETDKNKQYLEARLQETGHVAAAYRLIKDEPDQVASVLDDLSAMPDIRMILFNGGTGIAPRDTTYDVIAAKLEKTLPGFGEIFRMISYEDIGAAAMMSRAIAGVYRQTVIISMPGSTNAVKTAFEKLILPEINHLAWEIVRKS
ncbi:MAG: MogA/MoaB family molybdenum cofactor biosynthesis protein [Aggregatilineales bacterium]